MNAPFAQRRRALQTQLVKRLVGHPLDESSGLVLSDRIHWGGWRFAHFAKRILFRNGRAVFGPGQGRDVGKSDCKAGAVVDGHGGQVVARSRAWKDWV